MRLDTARPFVLLDDARADGAPARLYRDPAETIVAHAAAELPACLARLRDAGGRHAAGYIAYDAGVPGEPAGDARSAAPLLWFGLFDGYETVADVAAILPDPAGAWSAAPRPLVDRAAYLAAFDRVMAYIAAGDIYQANLTFQSAVAIAGDPLALYARLRDRAAAGWGGIVVDGYRTILSFSPELFFRFDGDRVTARPMKGTARRLADARADAAAARALADDPKQRAENLMIVDLLRNDLSRISIPGTVDVPKLFEVESYPTVHQMTSTIEGVSRTGSDAVSVIEAAFPCGSITGAPKLRAMEIAADVEARPRGLYTGAIGRIDADGSAAFNVAIRTLVIDGDGATLGLGSGIVADSDGPAEWRECLDKGAFVACPRFDLIETMRFDPDEGLPDLEAHLARMKASADALGFVFDRHAVRNELQAATFRLRVLSRVRVRASPTGQVVIEVRPAPPAPSAAMTAAVVPLPVEPADFRLRHKTSDRGFYDAARAAAGTDEVVFARPDGLLTEGSYTNLFVRGPGGMLRTPPAALGLLPGVLRARLIADGRAIEAELCADDLADGFLLGNALRGLFAARLPPGAT